VHFLSVRKTMHGPFGFSGRMDRRTGQQYPQNKGKGKTEKGKGWKRRSEKGGGADRHRGVDVHSRMIRISLFALVAAAPVAAQSTAQATQANVADQPIAPDSMAHARLSDLRTIPGMRFELRYATTNNFTGAVLPGYGSAVPLLRREAAAALARVQRAVAAQGFALKVWDGYRPYRATLGMVTWCERNHRVDLLDSGYIARRSRHNQGVAIDLTLVDAKTGQELPMGTGFDRFAVEAHTANATGEAARNRATLGKAMAAAGFVNYVDEWWHFSFEVSDPMPFDLALDAW
jgi:D-alanyl-D-alanine dipeptidase